MDIKVKMYTCGVPDGRGVIIPKEVMEKALDEYMKDNSTHIVTMDSDDYTHPNLVDAIGTLKDASINEDGEVYGDISIIHTPKGKVFEDIFSKIPDHINIKPMGYGDIEDGKFTNINITHFNVVI